MRKKVKEWHDMVVTGLVNGLSHVCGDDRREDIVWVRRRLRLWESFARCMINLETGQDYQYSEKDLLNASKQGYEPYNKELLPEESILKELNKIKEKEEITDFFLVWDKAIGKL